jgi:hypothetical protein
MNSTATYDLKEVEIMKISGTQMENPVSNENDEYGFFCDLETAKTMEYEKVEYYVVKVSTESYYKTSSTTVQNSLRSITPPIHSYLVPGQVQYEVRKKPIGLGEKPPNTIRISELADEPPLCTYPRISHTRSCCCINIDNMEHHSAPNQPVRENCFYSAFDFLARLPRDVYYSFTVCTVTATCVYLVMTFSNNSNMSI